MKFWFDTDSTEWRGVDNRWYHDNSQNFPNSPKFSVNDFGLFDGSRNFRKLISVSWEVSVSHGYDGIHWEATSCTTTAYRWLFRDSRPSLRILCSAVIKPPNLCARGKDPSLRLLHGTLVICGFQAYVAISVFGEVSFNTVLPFLWHHFWSITFRIWVRSFRGMCEHMRLQVL